MIDLTMKQVMKANNVAIAHDLDPCKFTEGLRIALSIAEILELPQDEAEERFYAVLKDMV